MTQVQYISTPIVCTCCGHKAKTGFMVGGKPYAIACASDLLGLRVSTLRKLAKQTI